MMVCLFHLGAATSAAKYFGISLFDYPFRFGHSGVVFFFVLSGFIIMEAHAKDIGRPEILKRYLIKRAIRIYPPYIIVFVSVFLMASLSTQLRSGLPSDPLLLLKAILLIPLDKTVVGGTGAPVVIVAWSLQYELVFYLLFALIIIHPLLLLPVLLSALVVASVCSKSCVFPYSFAASHYFLLFGMGCLASLALKVKTLRINTPVVVFYAGALIFLLNGIFEIYSFWSTGIRTTGETAPGQSLIYGAASFLLIFGAVSCEKSTSGLRISSHFLERVGDASYSLYLIHFPLISVLMKLFIAVLSRDVLGGLVAYILGFVICVAASLLFHVHVEQPVTNFLKRQIN